MPGIGDCHLTISSEFFTCVFCESFGEIVSFVYGYSSRILMTVMIVGNASDKNELKLVYESVRKKFSDHCHHL
jgi:hypothetical protein